jgi:hypothetical protein
VRGLENAPCRLAVTVDVDPDGRPTAVDGEFHHAAEVVPLDRPVADHADPLDGDVGRRAE